MSPLREFADRVHSRTRVGDRTRRGSNDTTANPLLYAAVSPFIFAVDGNGLLMRRATSLRGKCANTTETTASSQHRPPSSSNNDENAFMEAAMPMMPMTGDRSATGGGEYPRGRRPPLTATTSTSSRNVHSAAASTSLLSGLLPSAAAAASTTPLFTLRGVGCAARLPRAETAARPANARNGHSIANAAHDRRPPSSSSSSSSVFSASHATPRFNNYVIGHSAVVATSRGGTAIRRTAASRRPPRVPASAATAAATAMPSSPPPPPLFALSHSSFPSSSPTPTSLSCKETSASASAHSSARDSSQPGLLKVDRESLIAAATDVGEEAAGPQVGGLKAAVPATASVRPLLHRLPLHTNVGTASDRASAVLVNAEAASDSSTSSSAAATKSAAHDGNNDDDDGTTGSSTTRRVPTDPANGSSRRTPHVPPLPMTRTFALRRPVLLTKDTFAATMGGHKTTPRPSPREASQGEQLVLSPVMRPPPHPSVPERSNATPSPSLVSATCFPAYTPAPPRTSSSSGSSQPRQRSRRTSLASVASNSSASLHQRCRSLEEEAALTRLFFQAMPTFTDTSKAQVDHCSSAAEVQAATAAATQPPQDVAHNNDNASAVGRGSISITGLQRRSSLRSLPRASDSPQPRCGTPHAKASSVVDRLRERGNRFMMREEFAEAVATYSEGIRLAPSCDILWGNRAAAFLLTFRYLPAVADCLYVLALKPGSVKAYWRAAKAYAAAYRFLDAKKYYLLAQQACLKEDSRATSASSAGLSQTAIPCDSSGSGHVGDGTRNGIVGGGGAAQVEKTEVSTVDAMDRNRSDKAATERQSIAAEAAAVETVEFYWQHMRAERWCDAVAVMDSVLATGRYAGPTAVSWQALRLEALLPTQPKTALAEAEVLHRNYPGAVELFYVLAKALFYTVHDAANTRRCLYLLDEATAQRNAQNTMLNADVRYAALQLRGLFSGEGGDTAAVQLEAWVQRSQLREDSRVTELRHTIATFARHRDIGNAAYEKGNWDAAAAAYTQCLQTDRRNHALLAAVYCNRTAAYMQAGRWREALTDADAAIRLSPQLATAYGRRGRIQLYLLAQEYEAQRAMLSRHFTTQWSAAVKEQLTRYADAAVADLTRAVELSPTAEHKSQLQQAHAQRRTVKAALSAPQQGKEMAGSPASRSQAYAQQHSSGSAYQRNNTHSPSASSPYGVLQQHLQLLGLNSTSAAVGVLPDLKVVAKAYRECALRWHPDKWVTSTPQEQQEAERQFKLISVAYSYLRERYGDGAAKTS